MLRFLILLLFLLVTDQAVAAQELRKVLDLQGDWKFEIGDNPSWKKQNVDDSGWETIFVPSDWAEEGFPGYDGFAWYRKRFTLKAGDKDRSYFLLLGYVDDCDETFLNGRFVGWTGGMPPNYASGCEFPREYLIPKKYLNFEGENVLAVRVYDAIGAGGITHGSIGIYEEIEEFDLEMNLADYWKFRPGDHKKWRDEDYDDCHWERIWVPAMWQIQGYRDLLGFAWYRKSFKLDPDLKNEPLYLVLGYIDDLDETYLNGYRIGSTGKIYDDPRRILIKHENHLTLRAYPIPPRLLRTDKENVIAVRVYDGLTFGGIRRGPIGLVRDHEFHKWKRKNHDVNIFELFKNLFDE